MHFAVWHTVNHISHAGLYLYTEAAAGTSSSETRIPKGIIQHTSPDLWNQHNKFNRFWAVYIPSESPSAELGMNSVATGHLVDLKRG